jgi:mRNA-degrading endonuclease toxin of MazEF toxin-antitoxin module
VIRTVPPFDDLERGHVVLAPDPFKPDDDATRPWVVANNEEHPFDKQQYVVMGLTTQTWCEERIPLDENDYRHRKAPRDSSIVPHAVGSLKPALMTNYVCRVRDEPLDRAVEALTRYL